MTATSGEPTVVASRRPPRPTSSTATSTASRAKWSRASAVVASNIVASSRATSVPRASTPSTTPSSGMGSPSTRMRSRNETRCGEVYRPTRWPADLRIAASIAATEPLPLVPPTWTSRYRCSGRPSASRSPSIRSSPWRMPACSPPRSDWSRATASAYVTSELTRSGRLGGEERENAAEGLLEITPLDDHVELAVREQELRALESLGQRLTDRLRNDPWSGEPDQRARLGQDDVAEHREARGDAAGRGIGEDRDVRQPGGGKPLERGGGLGHLHQREDALLHPGAAGRRDDDDRQMLVDGELNGAGELLADDRAHAAAEEAELEDGEHGRLAADRRDTTDDRFVGRGLLGGRADAFAILLGVLERQRIGRHQAGLALLERASVGQLTDALTGGDAEGIVALRTDAPAAFHLGAVDDFLAGVALDPQA